MTAKDRQELMAAIDQFIDSIFGENMQINYHEYIHITTTFASDLFFLPMMMLHRRLPSSGTMFTLI